MSPNQGQNKPVGYHAKWHIVIFARRLGQNNPIRQNNPISTVLVTEDIYNYWIIMYNNRFIVKANAFYSYNIIFLVNQ